MPLINNWIISERENYGYVGPTEVRKGFNHLTSGVIGFIRSFWS